MMARQEVEEDGRRGRSIYGGGREDHCKTHLSSSPGKGSPVPWTKSLLNRTGVSHYVARQ